MKFGTSININVSLNTGKRDAVWYTRSVFFHEGDASLDTDNASVCIHPVIDAKGAGGDRGSTRYCNTARFYGKPGGVVEPRERRRTSGEEN